METTTIKTRAGHVTIKRSGALVTLTDQDGRRLVSNQSATAKAARDVYRDTVRTWRAAFVLGGSK